MPANTPALLPSFAEKIYSFSNINDEDDFGDFIFSSSPTPSFSLYPTSGNDEDWGDFVVSQNGSFCLQTQSNLLSVSKLDSSRSSNDVWVKQKGAIPLSIFGEEEKVDADPVTIEGLGVFESEFGSHSMPTYSSPTIVTTRKLNDLIERLYEQDCIGGKEDEDDFDEESWVFKEALSADAGLEVAVNRSENGWEGMEQLDINSQKSGLVDVELKNRSIGHNYSITDKTLHKILPIFENGTFLSSTKGSIGNGSIEKIHNDTNELLQQSEIQKVEKELNAGVDLLEHSLVLQSVRLASKEQQPLYINAWSKLASVCTEDLHLGAKIWTVSLNGGISKQILTKGSKHFIALGEVYRVTKILKATMRLYKSWLLSATAESTEMFTCLESDQYAWISSVFEEALQSISCDMDLDDKDLAKSLLESIKLIDKINETAFHGLAFSNKNTFCRFSLLPFDDLLGINKVVWNGEWYITKIANFWANRISLDPPELPSLQVFCNPCT